MTFLQKVYKKLPVVIFDCTAIPVAWYGAYWLRYNMHPFPIKPSGLNLIILFTVQLGFYHYYKVYRGLWRFCSTNDVSRIIKAVTIAIGCVIPIFYLTSLLNLVPRSIFPLYILLMLTFLCGGRLLRRAYSEGKIAHIGAHESKRVLVVGAGHAGESLVRDLKRTSFYNPIGFVDDNPMREGLEIHGVPVLGNITDLPLIVKNKRIEFIIIAIPSARSVQMRRIVSFCEQTAVCFQTLPTRASNSYENSCLNALRPVSIEDLLGRDPINLQWNKIGKIIYGQRVLVTGGGGSIGSELCRQIMALSPEALLIIDNSEFNLYQIEYELRQKYPEASLHVCLGSVNDFKAIDFAFANFKPHIVFHAAAYKHVPILEGQIRVAALNNIIGTQVVAEISAHYQVEKFVLISTDKAVNPVNIMGATKRMAEIFCQNFNEQVQTKFITVRFGNVLGSSGSVVPLFQKQIANGGPVTVTHPEVKRYFMTIPEACQLILQATVNGKGGEIFVLDMGEPIKISYLAQQMIKLAGKTAEGVEIKYTGLRAGEKLFEEIFHPSEKLQTTEHEKLLKAQFRRFDWQQLLDTFHLLNTACNNYQEEEIYILLQSLVPEFKPQIILDQEEQEDRVL